MSTATRTKRRQGRKQLPAWTVAERARVDVGAVVDVHAEGISLDALARRYAAPDGGPDAEGFERFALDLFGVALTPQQRDGAADLAAERRVLIVGGNDLGKDALVAWWALYEAYALGSLVLLTAPTDRQVREIVMRREVGRAWERAAGKLAGHRLDMGIRIPGRSEGGVLAFTATDPDHFQGHHAPRVFIGATEAQGIERPIFDAMRRCHPKLIALTCNPTSVLSVVYSFAQSDAWCTQHWSALDHPNVATGRVVVPGAVTREDVEDVRATEGEGCRFWQESVLGVWVAEVEDGIAEPDSFARAADPGRAQAAAARVVRLDPPNVQAGTVNRLGQFVALRPSEVSVGIDPSGTGRDQTAVAAVARLGDEAGFLVHGLHRHREPDSVTNAERCTALVAGLVAEERLAVHHVVCDETSLNAVLSPLKRLVPDRVKWTRVVSRFPHYDWVARAPDVRGFNASWQALAPARFANLRTQAYVEVGEALRDGRLTFGPGCDPALVEAVRQEVLAHQVKRLADGRWQLTPKAEVKALVGRSPDLSDALGMALLPWLRREKADRPAHKRYGVVFA